MIAIVDVCGGNLRSVEKALAAVGGDVVVTRDPDVVRRADKLVVPGQGAFAPFMAGLAERGLEAPIKDAVARGVPYLGICLGLQVLFDQSEEHGPVRGLGLVPGKVVRFVPPHHDIKIPHMGWNRVTPIRTHPLGQGLEEGAPFYFVHSYYFDCERHEDVLFRSIYGHEFTSGIQRDNVMGVQFHPEKSHRYGMQLIRNFVGL